jgi:probable O-glycosylation ligase (exosortase A-associated)
MLRTIFVLILAAIGAYYVLWGGTFYTLLFYIGNAYFRPEEWAWDQALIKSLKLSFISGAALLLSSFLSRQRFVFNGRVFLLFLFLSHTFVSALMAHDFAYSWAYWTDFFKSTIVTYMIVILVTDFARLRLLLFVIVLFVGVEGAKQGWFYLISPPKWGANPNGLPALGDNNGVAVAMLMLAPVIQLLGQTTQRKWARPVYWFLFAGVIARALTTYSRGGFLACIALGGAYLLRSRQKLRLLVGMAFLLAIILPALPEEFWNRMQTIETYEEEGSATGRLHFWRVAINMANAHPIFGIGYMSYLPAYDTYDFSEGEYGQKRAVHSSYFSVLAELGYLGAALFAAILIGALQSCRRVSKLTQHDPALSALGKSAFALQMSLIAFLCGGAFLSYAYKEIVWHFIGMTMAVDRLATQLATQTEAETLETEFSNVSVDSPVSVT